MKSKLLRRIPILSTLKPADLKLVDRIAQSFDYGPGETIFSRAESADHMFIVVSGRVRIFTRGASKKRKTFAYLAPGEFFGEMALIKGTRSASAEAVEASRLLVIRKVDFKRLLLANPRLTYYLLVAVSDRLRRADEQIESLLFRNILGRVAKTLCDLSRESRRFRGGMLLNEHYTQQELADLVGTTREPLARALASLRRADLVDSHHGRYFVKDPAKLTLMSVSSL